MTGAAAVDGQTNKKDIIPALKRWGAFLGIAAAVLFVVLLPFIISGKYLAWYEDGVVQHATFLEYMYKHGIFGGVGGYDYNIALGDDRAVAFAYYMQFDPINLLLYVMPTGDFLLAYSALAVVRFLLTAIFMYIYLRKHDIRQTLAVVFAVAYMTGGFMLHTYTKHPDLACGAVYLPLVILGVERAVDGKNPFVLMLSVFLTTISSFYMTYIVTVFAVMYAACYYVFVRKQSGAKITAKDFFVVFLRTALFYVVGLLCAAFVLLPVAHAYMTAARSASKGMAVYNMGELTSIIVSYIMPVVGAKYTPVMFNGATVMLALAAFASPKRSPYKIVAAITSAGALIPLVGYVFNLFNYVNNRYLFLASFAVFAMLADDLNDRDMRALPDNHTVNTVVKGSIAFLTAAVNISLWGGAELLISRENTELYVAAILMVSLVLVWSGLFLKRIFAHNFYAQKSVVVLAPKKIFTAFVALTVCFAAVYNFTYAPEFDDGKYYAALTSDCELYAAQKMREDDEYYRLDTVTHGYWRDAQNRPLNNGYRGTQTYNTMLSGSVGNFIADNEVLSFSTNLGISGLNSRIALQAITAARYYRALPGEYVPEQYVPVEGYTDLYETDKYYRFGTVFSDTLDYSVYDALPSAERQYAMLSAVFKDGGGKDMPGAYTERRDDLTVGSSTFTLKPGESKTIEPGDLSGNELYLSFTVAEPVGRDTGFTAVCGKSYISEFIRPKGDHMYTGKTEYLYKLDEKGGTIKLTADYGDDIVFDNVSVFTADSARVLAAVDTTRAHLRDTKFTQSGFTGSIDSDGGTMLVPLPYSTGWTAYIDGERVSIDRADGWFMSVDVAPGEHGVEFKYATPLYGAGRALSVAAAAIAAVITAAYIVRDVKKRKQ